MSLHDGSMPRRRLLALGMTLPLAARSQTTGAATRIVVGFSAGGATDIAARVLAQKLTETTQQPFIVDNKPGATGHIAGEFVARAKPDGQTLVLGASSTHVVSPLLNSRLPYRPLADFEPISMVSKVHNLVVAHPSLPAKDMREFIAYARANPGKVAFGSSGQGSNLHLAGELLKSLAGLDLVHVPYKGSAQAMNDLLGGQINLLIDNMPVSLPHVRAGRLKVLGIASPDRVPEFADVATVAETIPGYSVLAYAVLMAPSGTPRDIVQSLNAAVGRVLRLPDVVDGFRRQGFVPSHSTPEELTAFLQTETAKWAKVIRAAGIRAE